MANKRTNELQQETAPLVTDNILIDRPAYVEAKKITIEQVVDLTAASIDGRFVKEETRGVANGYAPLDSNIKIPGAYLPSYVDDVIEVANYAALPAIGETGKIYLAIDTGFQYRWSGSVYVRIVVSPGTTDELAEGIVNLYYTDARVASYGNAHYPQLGIVYENPLWIGSLGWDKISSKPTTVLGYGITDAYTKTETDLKYYTAKPALGNLYSNSNFTSLAGLSQNGSGMVISFSGGAMTVSNPAGPDVTHSLDIAGSAYCLPNWNFEVIAEVPSSPVASTQLIVGTRSIPGEQHQILAALDLTATGTAGRLRIVSNNGSALVDSTTFLDIAPGDIVKLTFTRIDFVTFSARAVNLTTNSSVDVSAIYDSEVNGKISTTANTGYLSLFVGTATPIKIISYTVNSNTPKNAEIAIGSDSKWGGYLASAYINTAFARLSQSFNAIHLSGGGDRTSSLLAQLPVLVQLKPKVLILDYSSNDYRNGIAIATTVANLTTAYNTLTAAGIQVWVCDGEYETANDLGPLAAAIRAGLPNVIPTFAWTKAVGTAGLTPDGYHLGDVNNEILATNVVKYIFNTSLKTPTIRPREIWKKVGLSILRSQSDSLSGAAGDRPNMLWKLWYNGTDAQTYGASVSGNTLEFFSARDHKFYGSIATPIVTFDNSGILVNGTGSPIITVTSTSTASNASASLALKITAGTLFQIVNWDATQTGNSLGLARAGKAYILNNNADALVIGNSAAQPIYLSTNNAVRLNLDASGRLGFGAGAPTAMLFLAAGSSAANSAPLKWNSGTLLTTPEVGADEFFGDKRYFTIATGVARKEYTLNDVPLTVGILPVTTTGGRLTNTSVTAAEAGYLSGVTSAIQTQINGKLGTAGVAANSTLWNGAAINAGTPASISGILIFDNTNSQYRLGSASLVNGFLGNTEGVWTPTSSLAMTVDFARYTKKGNQVTVTAQILITAVSGSGTAFVIGGLPFNNSANSQASGVFGLQNISTSPLINIGYGSSSLGFYNQLTQITEADVIGKQFLFSITYSTTN